MRLNISDKLSLKKVVSFNIITNLLVLLYSQVICDYFYFMSFIKIVPDIFNIITLIYVACFNTIHLKKGKICGIILLFFVIYALFSFAWSEGKLSDGIGRIRYILTGFWMFYCCTNYADSDLINKIMKILYVSIWIHTLLVVYQCFVLKVGIDISNGIFGFKEYNNAAQGIYCLALSVLGITSYMFKRTSRFKSMIMILLPCITCALSEIKAFYIEFAIVVLIVIFYCIKDGKKRNRILFIISIVIIGGIVAYQILLKIMPENLYAFSSLDSLIFYESWETGRAGGYGRFSQIQWVFSQAFSNDIMKTIFGLGILDKKEVIVYELSKTFFNFGAIGLILLISFFVTNIVILWKIKSKSMFKAVSICFSVVELISLFMWNATLNRMSYLGFMIIALGYCDTFSNCNEMKEEVRKCIS